MIQGQARLEDTLLDLERLLLDPATPTSVLLAHIADDFGEIGRSGRWYNKAQILEYLAGPRAGLATQTDFTARLIAAGVALATYRTTHASASGGPSTAALRSSVWVYRDERWQLLFHQGTPAV